VCWTSADKPRTETHTQTETERVQTCSSDRHLPKRSSRIEESLQRERRCDGSPVLPSEECEDNDGIRIGGGDGVRGTVVSPCAIQCAWY